MKTKQAIVTIALSSLAVSVYAGGFPGNPERDTIDATVGTSQTVSAGDGWKDFSCERTQYVGGGKASQATRHVYTKEEILHAGMESHDAPN